MIFLSQFMFIYFQIFFSLATRVGFEAGIFFGESNMTEEFGELAVLRIRFILIRIRFILIRICFILIRIRFILIRIRFILIRIRFRE